MGTSIGMTRTLVESGRIQIGHSQTPEMRRWMASALVAWRLAGWRCGAPDRRGRMALPRCCYLRGDGLDGDLAERGSLGWMSLLPLHCKTRRRLLLHGQVLVVHRLSDGAKNPIEQPQRAGMKKWCRKKKITTSRVRCRASAFQVQSVDFMRKLRQIDTAQVEDCSVRTIDSHCFRGFPRLAHTQAQYSNPYLAPFLRDCA